MAYPFLPVNPCCTDVVLNTPCGCSSTITNSGCNDNNPCSTHLTASSTIVYDGPTLPCIVAEPCDTLNVILQKIDEIICNLQTQINYLTNQVTNITNQIIMINGDIINIYNTLGECCGATTTTTSTTTAAPCESFSLNNTGVDPVAIIITDCNTGEPGAIVLMPGDTNICVITDSPLTVPGSVIVTPNGPCGSTTTTSTSSSSTTTTTTTLYACECLTFYNNDVVGHEIYYTDCFGITNAPITIQSHETIQVCGCCGFASDEFVTITVGANCVNGLCPSPTTTTTTTALCNCFNTEITITSQALASTDNGQLTALYNDCFGKPYINTYDTAGVYSLGCVDFVLGINVIGLIDGIESSIYVPITQGSPCCEGTTTTTSSTSSTTSTSTSSTTTTSTTAYVLACTAGYTGPVGFPNRTTGNGSVILGSGLTITTTYTGPTLLTGFQPPFTNCVGGYFGGNVGIGGSIDLNYNSGAFTFTITYSVPQTAVKFVLASIGYVDQLGISEYYTITTDSTNTTVHVIDGCGDFRVEAPNVVAGSMANPIDNIGGNIEVIADTPFTTVTITGNNPGSLAGTVWDMYICDTESTTTTTTTIACNCITFNNTDSSVIDHIIEYNDCNGDLIETTISANDVLQFCGCCWVVDSELVIVTEGAPCVGEVCQTTTTTSSTSSSTTTTTTTVPSISPSSAEYQASAGNGCASGDYPVTRPNIPAPLNFGNMFFPTLLWSDIEYVEIVSVTPAAGFAVKYNGVVLTPGTQLVPASAFTWANSMTITRDTFSCTNTVEQWTVKIKLYAYTELTNTTTFGVGFVQTLCPGC